MKGILPEATDWQHKLDDGRILSVGYYHYGEGANLNCVLQKDAGNGADASADFLLVHSINDVHNMLTADNVEDVQERFIADANAKLAAILGNVKPPIPKDIWQRLHWHFRWSYSFDKAAGKIVFQRP